MQEEAEDGSYNSSTPLESRSCWPVEGDLSTRRGSLLVNSWNGVWSSLPGGKQQLYKHRPKRRAFKLVDVGSGFWRLYFHDSFITDRSGLLSRWKKHLQRVFSHDSSHTWKAEARRNYCVVTLLLNTLHVIQ